MKLRIDPQKCVGCGICGEYCRLGMLYVEGRKAKVRSGCTSCGYCVQFCICAAISLDNKVDAAVSQ